RAPVRRGAARGGRRPAGDRERPGRREGRLVHARARAPARILIWSGALQRGEMSGPIRSGGTVMRFAAIAFVASMAAFAPATRAQDETLVLDDGFTLTGRVVSCSADGVEFEHRDEKGGKVVTKFATADVDPDDYYTLRAPKCASA